MSSLETRHPTNALLTVDDLASQLAISKASIYRMRSSGKSLPAALRIGSTLRWKQSSVDAWLADQVEKESAH